MLNRITVPAFTLFALVAITTGFAPEPQRPEVLRNNDNIRRGQHITIRVTPDTDFARALPNDARYVLENCRVYLRNSLASPRLLRTITFNASQGEIRLANLAQDARPGDQIIVEIGEVYRINFRNERIPVDIPVSEKIVSFILEN